jgi:integrative and conjugative element protein (TIGR02256 family)
MDATPLEFRSQDRRFGLVLSAEHQRLLFERCSASWPNETGGILVGYYTERRDLAVTTQIPVAPGDSKFGRVGFVRGLRGLQELLKRLWNQGAGVREYYLGEWHYHPGQAAEPSAQDEAQMETIAEDPGYRCPEPLLMIVGGSLAGGWSITARVYRRGRATLLLAVVPGEG